ncbi:MAG: hypothetical protein RBT35_07565 [Bacteroidales bacterium]|jgi:hypothetical protein|nr:hypothetical protein [Bacteroidales bacterium]
MTKDDFFMQNRINEIQTNFIKDGWLKIYESKNSESEISDGIYCCLANSSCIEKYKKNYDWPMYIGEEGKPTIYEGNIYKTNYNEEIEPFIFYRSFPLLKRQDSYIDISEEFILYFNLLEEIRNKNDRTYYYINECGEKEEVLIIQPNYAKIKLKYLKEYITIREMHLIVFFEFMRLTEFANASWEVNVNEKTEITENFIYNHLIRLVDSRIQNWIIGKVFITPNIDKSYHFDLSNRKLESYITGYDKDGNEVYEECKRSTNKYFTLTYFRKQVLDKYYDNPQIYDIDGFRISSPFFSLKIDNNLEDYVPVFLVELSNLPHNEQLFWKHYNIPPPEGPKMSKTYYETMIQGNWAKHPETPDLYFKYKYEQFNNDWESKFGWPFYKPLSKIDNYIFKSLHIPTSNNIKSFCETILSIVKLTIDRLNEKELSKDIELEDNDKGITKLAKFLLKSGYDLPEMIEFLKHLQNLRSGIVAHSFSPKNIKCTSAIEYFGINDDSYRKVAKDVFIKSINTLNTLENFFLKES